ncbi:hypothetical protein I5M27_01040 [Adhaeribacter sp. BT258]|uniref:Bulb-type lectin domain-containing protein n=1 Tax=Adhaeribacter terrigena TaxID=2793070 RepID=A0ABS1BWN1_9BACT|nr:hypothetical protein [Adhaeribacter terrigena]MBK0401547.1 hypothetical protein [Adhaeribacter terrigena]
MKNKYLLLWLFLLLSLSVRGQEYVNKDWTLSSGNPTRLEWSASHLTASHLYTLGNTYKAGENANFLLTKSDLDGNVIWTREYNAHNLDDFGVALITDANNNVYVTGAVTASNNKFDIAVVKYNVTGNLEWWYHYNGNSNLNDLPVGIAFDNVGNIVIAGTSVDALQHENIVTLSLDNSGNLNWSKLYDYASLEDGATGIIKGDMVILLFPGEAQPVPILTIL